MIALTGQKESDFLFFLVPATSAQQVETSSENQYYQQFSWRNIPDGRFNMLIVLFQSMPER